VALVPVTDPMTEDDGHTSVAKTNVTTVLGDHW
jgi:hypothetical protein